MCLTLWLSLLQAPSRQESHYKKAKSDHLKKDPKKKGKGAVCPVYKQAEIINEYKRLVEMGDDVRRITKGHSVESYLLRVKYKNQVVRAPSEQICRPVCMDVYMCHWLAPCSLHTCVCTRSTYFCMQVEVYVHVRIVVPCTYCM